MKLRYALIMTLVLIASGCANDSPDQNQDDSPETPAESDNGSTDDTSVQDNTETENTQRTVTHTSSGFENEEITVEQGTTVTWESDTNNMWVASDVHPTHTQYEGSSTTEHCQNQEPVSSEVFDQCTRGETFSFTFEKTGEWSYHNHANSGQKGTVIVE